jgi:uncharacterized protein (TIGR02099 family)
MHFRVLRILYHFAVYAVGITVMLAAVLVTVIRLALPDIGIYRSEVEAWVSRYMGFPVAIRSIEATWQGWVPHLYLTDVDLLNRAGTSAITHFESARVSIAPVSTLLERRFVPRELTVSGFELSVIRGADGAISVEGVDIEDPSGNELGEWLFLQESIRIQRATVEWRDHMHGQEPILLTDVNVNLRTDGRRVQIEGSTVLPPTHGRTMDFALDATGDLLSANWSGDFYVSARDVNPERWYRDYRPLRIDTIGGNAEIRVWSTWSAAALEALTGELRYRNFEAAIGEASVHVSELAYRFDGRRTPDGGWIVDMNVRDLVTQHGLWPQANIRVHTERTGLDGQRRLRVTFDFLKLDDLAPLAARLDFIPQDLQQRLAGLSLAGELQRGEFVFDPAETIERQFRYDLSFARLSTGILDPSLPMIAEASGRVSGDLGGGTIALANDAAVIGLPATQLSDIRLREIDGTVHWARDGGTWQIETQGLRFRTPDFPVFAAGSLTVDGGSGRPFADFMLNVGAGDMMRVADYVPLLPKFRLKEWMEHSIAGGRLKSASMILRGVPAQFPFDDGGGRFQAIVDIEDGSLEYSTAWPGIEEIDTELVFDGRTLEARIAGARIFGSRIGSATARMPDILAPGKLLTLAGPVAGGTGDLARFIRESPLSADPILKRAAQSLSGGEFAMSLALDIPIRIEGRMAGVDGTLRLHDAELQSDIGRFHLRDISGTIAFSRTAVQGDSLSATFHGVPVDVSLAGSKDAGAGPAALTIRGAADQSFIVSRLTEYFPGLEQSRDILKKKIIGNGDWELKLGIFRDAAGSLRNHVDFHSDLRGIELTLPEPAGKTRIEERPLHISADLDGPEAGQVAIRYGDLLSADLSFARDGSQGLEAAVVRCGPEVAVPAAETGIHLVGNLEVLPLSEWWSVVRSFRGEEPPVSGPDPAFAADLRVARLRAMNQEFPETHLLAARNDSGWEVRFDGPELAGLLKYPGGTDRAVPLELSLDRLRLAGPGRARTRGSVDPRSLPAMQIEVAEFHYGDQKMGHLALHASPLDDGIIVDQFELHKPGLDVHGSGRWLRLDDRDESKFMITLHADQMNRMLRTFGYDVDTVRKGETDMSINATWAGAPMDFSLAELNGTLDIQIKKGQLLDMDPKAGRLFGLLSIQTLPRRLSLDFTDLFGKGMAFDHIRGRFDIMDGHAYTNDLQLRGPAANVSITGRTGLADQDYDQLVTVTPQIADTLPLASALFGPVGIGVGAVLYFAGEMFRTIHEKIDQILQYQYTITGSWDSPVIEKYKGQVTAGDSG